MQIQPIHIPGAVQGFGVLIALEEDLDSGNLVVRIVSEVRVKQCNALFDFIRLHVANATELFRNFGLDTIVPVQSGMLHAHTTSNAGGPSVG